MKTKLFTMCTIFVLWMLVSGTVSAEESATVYYANNPAVTAYTYEMLTADLQLLQARYPEKIQVFAPGSSVNGLPIYEAIVGKQDAPHAIYVQASMHSREHINTQIVVSILSMLMEQDLKNTCFYVIPMMNPDGVSASQFLPPARRSKENAYGVDLNRNFPIGWENVTGKKAMVRGQAPLDQPESRLMVQTVGERVFDLVINYHSMGNIVYYGSSYGSPQINAVSQGYANYANAVLGYKVKSCVGDRDNEGGSFGDYLCYLNIPYITIENGASGCPVNPMEFAGLRDRNFPVWMSLIQ